MVERAVGKAVLGWGTTLPYLTLPYLGFCWSLGREEEEEMGFLALFASAWRRVVYGAVRCLW